MWRYFLSYCQTIKFTNMSDLEKKARIFSNTEGNQSSKLMREVEYDTGRYVGYLAGFKDCEKEYEEKIRWIPVEEKLPEDCPELFLRKVITKNLLVKRKWNDTGEIVVELNSRFLPSPKVGFVWNYDYENSEIIEWRSFL